LRGINQGYSNFYDFVRTIDAMNYDMNLKYKKNVEQTTNSIKEITGYNKIEKLIDQTANNVNSITGIDKLFVNGEKPKPIDVYHGTKKYEKDNYLKDNQSK